MKFVKILELMSFEDDKQRRLDAIPCYYCCCCAFLLSLFPSLSPSHFVKLNLIVISLVFIDFIPYRLQSAFCSVFLLKYIEFCWKFCMQIRFCDLIAYILKLIVIILIKYIIILHPPIERRRDENFIFIYFHLKKQAFCIEFNHTVGKRKSWFVIQYDEGTSSPVPQKTNLQSAKQYCGNLKSQQNYKWICYALFH